MATTEMKLKESRMSSKHDVPMTKPACGRVHKAVLLPLIEIHQYLLAFKVYIYRLKDDLYVQCCLYYLYILCG